MADNMPLLLLLGAGVAYFVFKPGAPVVQSISPTLPAGTVPAAGAATTAPLMITLADGTQVPFQASSTAAPVALIGINSGQSVAVPGGTVVVVSNYADLVAQNPNLGSPNYQMTSEENAQYLNNYLDLRQWDYSYGPAFQGPPLKGQSIQQAAQWHWTNHGCAERRVFCPLVPSSVIPYSGAQPAKSTSVLGDVLKVVTVIGAGVAEVASAGTLTPIVAPAASIALTAESSIKGAPVIPLNATEKEILYGGAAILSNILPFYKNSDEKVVNMITNQLTSLLNQYQ